MSTVLHVSIRVNDPARSAALFAELLDAEVFDTPLAPFGVVCIALRRDRPSWLVDMLEFWPADKHWRDGALQRLDAAHHQPFGHFAFASDKSWETLEAIAKKHGLLIRREERNMPAPVPVLWDFDGNYLEFFPEIALRAPADPFAKVTAADVSRPKTA
jgi:hypothetical protein